MYSILIIFKDLLHLKSVAILPCEMLGTFLTHSGWWPSFFAPHYTNVCIVYVGRFFMLVNHSQTTSSALWLLYFKFTSRHRRS